MFIMKGGTDYHYLMAEGPLEEFITEVLADNKKPWIAVPVHTMKLGKENLIHWLTEREWEGAACPLSIPAWNHGCFCTVCLQHLPMG